MSEELNVIFHACMHGRTDIVQRAIQSVRAGSTNPSVEDSIAQLISTGRAEDGQTPLHVAASHGHADVIRALLSAGADLSVRGTFGEVLDMRPYDVAATEAAKSAFHIYLFEAIALDNVDMVHNLLRGGVPPTVTDGSTKMDTALHWAASSGVQDIVKLLIAYGADIRFVNTLGQTPLHSACLGKKASAVLLLLEAGAEITVTDLEGNSPRGALGLQGAPTDKNVVEILRLLDNPPSQRTVGGVHAHKRLKGVTSLSVDADGEHELLEPNKSVSYAKKPVAAVAAGGGALDKSLGASGDSVSIGHSGEKDEVLASAGIGRGRLNTDQSMLSVDPYDVDEDAKDGCVATPMDPILVLWPPPQRMNRRNTHPFVLSNDAIITLSAPSTELDTVSSLVESLGRFQFRVEICPPLAGSVIKLHIDENICTKRNSYEVIIDPGQLQIIASDSLGLRYGVQTFVQLMQLHSDLSILDASGTAVMKLPSVSISDWPDVDHRAVLWSHRSLACHQEAVLTDVVTLLSKTRINSILLSVDNAIDKTEMVDDDYNIVSGNTPVSNWAARGDELSTAVGAAVDSIEEEEEDDGDHGDVDNNSSGSVTDICRGIAELKDQCDRQLISLVPMLTFSSLAQRASSRILRRFRGEKMVVLVLDYEQQEVAQELIHAMRLKEEENRAKGRLGAGTGTEDEDDGIADATRIVTKTDVENAIKQRCADIMCSLKAAGFSTVTLVCNEWLKRIANPLEIVFRFGLSGVERPGSVICPARHTSKPLLGVKEFIYSVHISMSKARDLGSSLVTFPAFLDNDVMMPLLLSKYHSFIFAGFAWNALSVIDMLRDPVDPDASVLREVAYLLLFSSQPDINQPEYSAILSLFSGGLLTDRSTGNHGSEEDLVDLHNGGRSMPAVLESRRFARTEQALYALLRSRENVGSFQVLEQADVALVSKYYKRLLTSSQWKLGKSNGSSELKEFFSVVCLVHGLAKAMVYSYAGKEKIMKSLYSSGTEKVTSSANITPISSPRKTTGSETGEKHAVREEDSEQPLVSYSTLFSWVAPGTNSDTANFFLECLEHLSVLWQKRYRTVWFHAPSFYDNLSKRKVVYVRTIDQHKVPIVKPVIAPDPHMKHDGQDAMTSCVKIRRNFYRREREGVPTTAIFNAGIMARLPSPKVVETTLLRLFGGSEST